MNKSLKSIGMHYQWRGNGHVADKKPNNQNQYDPQGEEADQQNNNNKHNVLNNTDYYVKNNREN